MRELSSISKISNGVELTIPKDSSWSSFLILILTSKILSSQKHIIWLMMMSLFWRRLLGKSNFCCCNKKKIYTFTTSSYVGIPCRTEIEWYPGKILTQKLLKKKPRKGSKNVKPITKTEDCDSFFNFFNPPQVPEDDDDIDEDTVSFASFKMPMQFTMYELV